MGAWVKVGCPLGGCDYKASMRLGVVSNRHASACAQRIAVVGHEHPENPVDRLLLVAGDEPGRL